jgi:hypothetical protein
MRLESVRELKIELTEPLRSATGLVVQDAPSVSLPAGPTTDLARIQPTVALGVAPSDGDDYKLAVRIQHRDLVDSARLEAIHTRAHGEVDVRYLGSIAKQHEPWHRTTQRPILIGSSVGHHAITAGSVGAFLKIPGRSDVLLLSNNHVLANENRGSLGDAILQPGSADGGRAGRDTVGVLERFVALDVHGINAVDCATAAIDESIDVDPRTLSGHGDLTGTADPWDADAVVKVGRTTGLTDGVVTAFEVDNVIVDFNLGRLRFDGQIEISGTQAGPFSEPGDSGSLVVAQQSGRAVGLLFAGSDQGGPNNFGVTYANPIGAVLDQLGAELWLDL